MPIKEYYVAFELSIIWIGFFRWVYTGFDNTFDFTKPATLEEWCWLGITSCYSKIDSKFYALMPGMHDYPTNSYMMPFG